MDQIVAFIDSPSAIRSASSSEDGYVEGTVAYMVMDDLEVKPLSICTLVALLTQFNVKEIGDIKVKVVDVGMYNFLHLFSLHRLSFLVQLARIRVFELFFCVLLVIGVLGL